MPVEFARRVYEALTAAGAPHGLADGGLSRHRIAAAGEGLSRLGRRDRPGPHAARGRAWLGVKLKRDCRSSAARRWRRSAPRRCRACSPASRRDPTSSCWAARRSTATASACGWLASGGFGYTIGKTIGYGYVDAPAGVDADFVLAGEYELEVAGERVPARAFLKPPYDPTGLRARG